MEAGNEAAAIDLAAARCTVTESDDVGATLTKPALKGQLFRVIGEWNETGVAVAIVAHENRQLAIGFQGTGTICYEQSVAFKERTECRRAGKVTRIVGVEFLPPVWRVNPRELKTATRRLRGIARILILVQIAGPAVEGQFLAHVTARAASGHGVKHAGRFVISEQVLDEIAAAVTGIAAVAIVTGPAEMIEAGKVRDRTGVNRCQWQFRVTNLLRSRGYERAFFLPCGKEWIDGVGSHGRHGVDPFMWCEFKWLLQ